MVSRLNRLMAWLGGKWLDGKRILSFDELVDLRKQVEALHLHVQERVKDLRQDQVNRLALITTTLDEVSKKIPLAKAAWDAKSEADQLEIESPLEDLFEELRYLNQEELRLGRGYFFVFFGLLIILLIIYGSLHVWQRWESMDNLKIINAAKHLRTIEINIKRAKANGKFPTEDLKHAADAVRELRETTKTFTLSTTVWQLLGAVEGEVGMNEIPETDTPKLTKAVLAELDSVTSTFLWNDQRKRWLEIAWWAEFGTLVGILFYIAGTFSEGWFSTAKTAMFWTEIVIAPLVVLAIFFLFSFSGITAISLQETSISGSAGFAFILGFSIRRTLGLLDTIKKRLLPDPAILSSRSTT
jgi:hypothetical protein